MKSKVMRHRAFMWDGVESEAYKPEGSNFSAVTRQVLLELARHQGMETEEARVRREDLAAIDGAFVCSTLMEIRAVSRLGERTLPTIELPVYKSLVSAFRAVTHQ